jgi:hypothetical protein
MWATRRFANCVGLDATGGLRRYGASKVIAMANQKDTGAVADLLRTSAKLAFRRAYRQVRVDPERYLRKARGQYGLPIQAWSEVRGLDERVIVRAAKHIVSSSARTAGLEGMGFGFAGLIGSVPDMGILAAITVRMLQKLSLMHGFEFATDREAANLLLAVASAAGLDFGREFLEKQAMERLVPRIIDQVALKAGAEVAEKWVGRIVPVVGAGVSGALNYYFVRAWGRRAQRHFLDRHRGLRPPVRVEPRLLERATPA